MMHKTRRNTVN